MSPTVRTRRQWTRLGGAAAVLVFLQGCIFPMGGERTGRSLSSHGEVVRGTTTKEQLVDWFGAPMAIAGPGESVEVPAATVHHQDPVSGREQWYGGGSWLQDGDAWLELFAERRPFGDAHRVYYWYTSSDGGLFVWPVFLMISQTHESLDELWVLVDERTGLVMDVAYRER